MIEVLKQALEALEQVTKELLAVRDELAERGARPTTNVFHQRLWDSSFSAYTDHAIPAAQSLRQAIRERALYEVQRLGQEIEQEPVAWMKPDVLCDRTCMYLCTKGFTQFPECATTHPPQRTWVGLTDEERNAIEAATLDLHGVPKFFATAIEAKLKQKNGFAEEKNND